MTRDDMCDVMNTTRYDDRRAVRSDLMGVAVRVGCAVLMGAAVSAVIRGATHDDASATRV